MKDVVRIVLTHWYEATRIINAVGNVLEVIISKKKGS